MRTGALKIIGFVSASLLGLGLFLLLLARDSHLSLLTGALSFVAAVALFVYGLVSNANWKRSETDLLELAKRPLFPFSDQGLSSPVPDP